MQKDKRFRCQLDNTTSRWPEPPRRPTDRPTQGRLQGRGVRVEVRGVLCRGLKLTLQILKLQTALICRGSDQGQQQQAWGLKARRERESARPVPYFAGVGDGQLEVR